MRKPRPSYRAAIYWLAANDDCEWLRDADPIISVSAALVQDLWDVESGKLYRDIVRELRKLYPSSWSDALPWEPDSSTTKGIDQ